jgi:hypothetical protein
MVQLPDWPSEFLSSHFPESNIVLHLRTTERKTTSGEVILFVEELQSDWFNGTAGRGPQGLCAGSRQPAQRAWSQILRDCFGETFDFTAMPFRSHWHELGVKVALLIANQQGFKRVGFSNERVQIDRWGEHAWLRRIYGDLIPSALRAVAKKHDCELGWDGVMARKRRHDIRRANDDTWEVSARGRRSEAVKIGVRGVADHYVDQRGAIVCERSRVLTIGPRLEQALNAQELPLWGW